MPLTLDELIHELRTPLQTATLAAGLLEGSDNAATTIRSALAHLHDLLAFAGGAAGVRSCCSLRVTVAEATLLADPTGRVEIRDDLPSDLQVPLDATLLRQLILIVLTNALKYSPIEHPVRLELHAEHGTGVVSVCDQGGGVSAGEVESIFRTGSRGSASHGTTGSGLGLAIARRIARSVGGDVILVDTAESGSCFQVRLPGQVVHPAGIPSAT